MFGSIGDDNEGRILKEIVDADGVTTRFVALSYTANKPLTS